MLEIENKKISFWCLNHEKPVEMQIQNGMSQFYACPKYFAENRTNDEKMCVNRMTIIDAAGIIDKFARMGELENPFETYESFQDCVFEYRGTKSKIQVRVLKYTDSEIRFGIRNMTALR